MFGFFRCEGAWVQPQLPDSSKQWAACRDCSSSGTVYECIPCSLWHPTRMADDLKMHT